jgi:hypothetical protein
LITTLATALGAGLAAVWGDFVKIDRQQDIAKANRLRAKLLPRQLNRQSPDLAAELAQSPSSKALASNDAFDRLNFLETCEPSGIALFADEKNGEARLVYAPKAALGQRGAGGMNLRRGDVASYRPRQAARSINAPAPPEAPLTAGPSNASAAASDRRVRQKPKAPHGAKRR